MIAPAEARQRWRLVYARSESAPHLAQPDQQSAWEAALLASGLPVVGQDLEPPRPRIAFAAPLGVGLPAERELADLFLAERLPVAGVRSALEANLPEGHRLVELHDVWLGEAALPGQVVAADYRAAVRVGAAAVGREAPIGREAPVGDEALVGRESPVGASGVVAEAARRLLTASSLPRTRDKGGQRVAYDLRPLLADISVIEVPVSTPDDLAGPAASERNLVQLRIRVRYDPERGVGRPEEVLAALAAIAGVELAFEALVRERVILAR